LQVSRGIFERWGIKNVNSSSINHSKHKLSLDEEDWNGPVNFFIFRKMK